MSTTGPTSLFVHTPIPDIELFHQEFDTHSIHSELTGPIGKLSEAAFMNSLANSSDYEVLGQSIQIQGKERTLGELDFLIRDTSERICHIEFVSKYYLYIPWMEGDTLGHWIGPNFKDRLSFKLNHLRDHQFPILHTDACRELLKDNLEIDPRHGIQQMLSFYAELYTPYSGGEINWHPDLDKECVRGQWMFLSEFEGLTLSDKEGFYCCRKRDWLRSETSEVEWEEHSEVLASIIASLDRGHSPMLWHKTERGIKRLFVIPNGFREQR